MRLVAFAAALLAAFAAAVGIGRAVGPLDRSVAKPHAEEQAEKADADALSVQLVAGPSLGFRVVDADGRALRDYDVLHARRMHVIVVRRDLTGFMHLHPTLRFDGTWFVPLALPAPGSWAAFADFSTGGARTTLTFDLNAPGRFEPRPLPAPSRVAQAGPYRVRLGGDVGKGDLRFTVTREGRPVRVQPYLGARGHLVVLRFGDLRYLHVHADEDALAFEADFPSPGRYRAFLQFRHGGAVRTAAFTLRVGPA